MDATSYICVLCKFCMEEIALQEIHPDFGLLPFPSEEFTVRHEKCGLEFRYDLYDVSRNEAEHIPEFEAHPNFPRIALATMYGGTEVRRETTQ